MGEMLGDIHHGRIIISRVIRWTKPFFLLKFFALFPEPPKKVSTYQQQKSLGLKLPLFLGPGDFEIQRTSLKSPLRCTPGCGCHVLVTKKDDMKHFFGAWEIPVPKPSQSQPKPSQSQPKPSLVTIASWGPGGRPKGCFLNPPFMHESTGKLTHSDVFFLNCLKFPSGHVSYT